jgi:hypothetical protein
MRHGNVRKTPAQVQRVVSTQTFCFDLSDSFIFLVTTHESLLFSVTATTAAKQSHMFTSAPVTSVPCSRDFIDFSLHFDLHQGASYLPKQASSQAYPVDL